MGELLSKLTINPAVALAVGLMAILIMMVLPVPPIVLDIGLMASFAFAILIFTTTLFVERPLDFSSFPAILLVSLLLRLALNISSTKLIIGQGHTGTGAAGGVIEGFAMFIMGGSIAIGLIVFAVLVIVNFLVITKGAGRMAEVGARFALDAMPGKQLAIDADVSSGAITHEEAKVLRAREQQETAFLGSLDGVSKFVKGDAVAGLLITLLNLIAGIAVGMLVHRISFGEAVQNYSVLTVGDGLVSQIPAVVISVAAALLLSKGRGEEAVDLALVRELGGRPEALVTVGVVMVAFALFPGLPFLPFVFGAGILFYLAWRLRGRRKDEPEAVTPAPAEPKANFGDLLDVDEIHVELSPDLVAAVIRDQGGFDTRVDKIRRFIIQEFGFILPPVRVTDRASLPPETYEIKIQGVRAARGNLRAGKWLALIADDQRPDVEGEHTKEPVYGAAARWVDFAGKEQMVLGGYTVVEPAEVLATHLLESVQAEFGRLMTRRALRTILDAFTQPTDPERAQANRRFIDEMIPERVPMGLLQQVLTDLLQERVSIRQLPIIIEACAEARGADLGPDDTVEYVRRRIAFGFVSKLTSDDGTIPAVQIGDDWSERLTSEGGEPSLETMKELVRSIGSLIDKAAEAGVVPVVAVAGPMRRLVRRILATHGMRNPVLSLDEIRGHAKPVLFGTA
ncbi:flagellar biosynthesis protein FlhA [Parvularcula lutaonensis]|uniref:Flagellar biosynthesis protein FlhA n=1 Tax=Parvularcula lutaonensis TaxID=491923 RepID=A0ABV7M849_9PROT|nr:flagellar biosynthesis protein FlhA [Parvularcula lutaonensis]GGY43845.1 flagellar biosynthesis protein FlhA [Parvularcula lutaonensis]